MALHDSHKGSFRWTINRLETTTVGQCNLLRNLECSYEGNHWSGSRNVYGWSPRSLLTTQKLNCISFKRD